MTNLLFVSYSSKISSNRVNFILPYAYVTDFVSSICNLKTVFLADFVSSICNLKACFEQPAASFLVCSLIFIEYQI
ncbi:Uncharacterised protein [Streptococcus pneumoniae]|nr:Uncharacterised protein [Streptococcus pneumoniae]